MTGHSLSRVERSEMLRTRDYLPMVPVVLFFSIASQPGLVDVSVTAGWLLVNAVSLALTGKGFWATRWALRASAEKTVSLWWLGIAGGALGAIKGVTTGWGGVLFGLESSLGDAIASRVIQTTLLGVVVVVGVSVAAQARYLLQEHRRLAVATEVAQRLSKLHHIEQLDAPTVRRALMATRQALSASTAEGATLEDIAHSVVRPLSHELWHRSRRDAPRMTLRSIYRRALGHRSYLPVVVGVAWWLTTIPALLQRGDLWVTLGTSLGFALGLSAMVWSAARLPLNRPLAVLAMVGMAFGLLIGLGSLLGQAVWGERFPLAAIGDQVASWLWAVIIVVGTATLGAVYSLTAQPAAGLANMLTDQDVGSWSAGQWEELVASRLARFLHGEVVNKLLMVSNGSHQAGSDDAVLAEETKRELLRQLDSGVWLTGGHSAGGSLSTRLADVAERWRGIIEVTVSGSEHLGALQPLQEAALLEAVGEAISNSYRHGLSTAVWIDVEPGTGGRLVVVVRDNGVGPRGGVRGVGSDLYDQLTAGRWSMGGAPGGGAQLHLTLSPMP